MPPELNPQYVLTSTARTTSRVADQAGAHVSLSRPPRVLLGNSISIALGALSHTLNRCETAQTNDGSAWSPRPLDGPHKQIGLAGGEQVPIVVPRRITGDATSIQRCTMGPSGSVSEIDCA